MSVLSGKGFKDMQIKERTNFCACYCGGYDVCECHLRLCLDCSEMFDATEDPECEYCPACLLEFNARALLEIRT